MAKPTNSVFGQRPQGQGVSPAQWKKWHASFDNAPALPFPLPKHPLTKEIYLAGCWLDFQLEKLGVSSDLRQHECSELGSSAMMLLIKQTKSKETFQFLPQDIWKLGQEVVARYAAQQGESDVQD